MIKKIIIPVLIFFIAVTAYFFVMPDNELPDEDETSEYTLIKAQRRDINQSVVATGIIKPKIGAEVKVGAQVSGIVKEIYFDIGSKVKRNQLLAVIEPDVFMAKVDLAAGMKEEASIEKKFAEIEYNRAKTLHSKKVISDQEYELASRKFEIAGTKLKQAEADHAYAALQLSYTQIKSPIDGVISAISTQKGETVAASFAAPTFFTIINLDRLELWAYVDETDIGRIKTNQEVSFTVDTYPGDFFSGIVETIYPKAEIQNNVVNYITVIKITPAKGIKNNTTLRPEMTATAEIFTSSKKDALVLPKKAVLSEGGKFFINLIENGKVQKKNITIGLSDNKYYEITSGLTENTKVVIK